MDTLPWETAPDLPWQVLTHPATQWQVMPSFLVGEYVVIACALLALWHALHKGRAHVVVWVAALVAGTANDMIFMALPLVDNFWQAQASIMLTPRLPLYIPCMYVCFMYYPTVAVRGLNLARWPTAALTGLTACLFYAPYDIVGAKFLWWTWHDTDAPTAQRLLGAPASSSLWVLTFVGAFGYLLDRCLRGRDSISSVTFAKALALVSSLTTLLMMAQFQILRALEVGRGPGYLTLGLGLAFYGVAALPGLKAANSPTPAAKRDPHVAPWATTLYFLALAGIMTSFSPESHVSAGLHQVPGPCDERATDITGVTRRTYLCLDDFAEDFDFRCTTAPASFSRWYTLCGQPHKNRLLYFAGVWGLSSAGAIAFLTMFLSRKRSAVPSVSSSA